MYMQKISKLFFVAVMFIAVLTGSACRTDNYVNTNTLRHLYSIFKNGEIDECRYNGKTVYCAGLNAYDAGSVVYDMDGNRIGNCNYAWGPVDPICNQLENCQVIYRCANHISGEPFVDKYGLSR